MPHNLDPLLRPASLAVVGASQRKGIVGNTVVKNLLAGGYRGELFTVNPRYREVEGVACFPSLRELPCAVEHVIFTVNDASIEQALDEAIACGVTAVTIYSSLYLAGDSVPPLRERVRKKALDAGILLGGGNGMGFYHFAENVWACGFPTRTHRACGNVAYISQSGAGMSGIVDVDARIDFNLAVSTGQELVVTMEDYLDYALAQPQTRVIGLFMETSRRPAALIAALERAKEQKIPIVVLKVGRTELSSKLTQSHTGAMAGADEVYEALFHRYGVQRVNDMDELSTALIMFAQPQEIGRGGLVSIHDSGGERQLLVDLADSIGVELTRLSRQSTSRLAALLDPGLDPVNPLDAWSAGGADADRIMEECFAVLLSDPDAAMGAAIHDRAPEGTIYKEYAAYLRRGHEASGKPVFLVAARQGTGTDPLVLELTREGKPVLDGVSAFLQGARCMMGFRDFLARTEITAPVLNDEVIRKWRARLPGVSGPDEHLASRLLSDCGIPMLESAVAVTRVEVVEKAAGLGYPLVMKTAEAGIAHKSDRDGVILNIRSEQQLLKHYADLSTRLGNRVLLAPMYMEEGIEMILGIVRDRQFGPLVSMGIGGVHTEFMQDLVLAMPPFDEAYALQRLESLKLRRLLDGARGRPAVDVQAYCRAAARLSVVALAFSDLLRELEVNPLKLTPNACVGLDALIILEKDREHQQAAVISG